MAAGGQAARAFAIKAAIDDPASEIFIFTAQKTMYGGKLIAAGDVVFLFASETQGGKGLVARGAVAEARPLAKTPGVDRETPRVSAVIRRTGLASRPLGRTELKLFKSWDDGRPETELNFKFYRQATNKIVGLSQGAALFLDGFFDEVIDSGLIRRGRG